jgi:hypothetical protein
MGDPWRDPERYSVDREMTRGEILAGYAAGMSVILGGTALFVKPLMFATIALVLAIIGTTGGGQAAKIARIGVTISIFGFFFGMLFSILTERPLF